MNKVILIISFIILIIFLTGLDYEVGSNKDNHNILSDISFIDQSGIVVSQESEDVTIVSLSSIHTENLFEIGAASILVGVDSQSIYPIEALDIQSFRTDKKVDIDQLIELNPDYVLVEPEQKLKERKLVATLESNNISVISLLPETMDEFEVYITKLGILSSHQEEAKLRLEEYYIEFDKVISQVKKTSLEKSVFIETSEKGYFVPAKEHIINETISLAGGQILIPKSNMFNQEANDQIKAGSEFIISNNDNIDSYFSITGHPYSGASLISFGQKDGFKELNVYKSHNVYNISTTLLGVNTFRYIEGIKEFHRLIFKDDSLIKTFNNKLDEPLTRLSFAQIVYDYYCLPTYMNADSSYYEFSKFNHTYGGYQDVKFNHTWYHVIETVTMKGYLKPKLNGKGEEYFGSNDLVTVKDLEQLLIIRLDISIDESREVIAKSFMDQVESYTNEDLYSLLCSIKGDEVYD